MFGKNKLKTGVIQESQYIKNRWATPLSILNNEVVCDAIVMPASLGIEKAREYTEDPRSKSIPLIVLKGKTDFLEAGAQLCVRKINSNVIVEVNNIVQRLNGIVSKDQNYRNEPSSKILVLGSLLVNHHDVTMDPNEASFVITDPECAGYAPPHLPLYIVGSGSVITWMITKKYPHSIICVSIEEALNKIYPKPTLILLPGAKDGRNQSPDIKYELQSTNIGVQ